MRRGSHDAATVARFVATGLGAALLLLVMTWSLAALGLAPFAAGALGYALAFAVAYLVQRSWSFRGRHAHRHALPRYLAAQALAALTSGAAAHLATAMLSWGHGASAFTATVAASAVSFVLSLFWVFPPQTEATGG